MQQIDIRKKTGNIPRLGSDRQGSKAIKLIKKARPAGLTKLILLIFEEIFKVCQSEVSQSVPVNSIALYNQAQPSIFTNTT